MRGGDIECSGPCKRIVRADNKPPDWKEITVAPSAAVPSGRVFYCPSCPVPEKAPTS